MNNSIDSGTYQLIQQADGNLVFYRHSPYKVCWASNKHGANSWAKYQGDGNLVVWSDNGLLWASNTNGTTATAVTIAGGTFKVGAKVIATC